jgi:hypothetical protein
MAYPRADLEPVTQVIRATWRATRHEALRAVRLATMATLVVVGRSAQAGPFEAIAGWEGDSHVQGYGFAVLGAQIPSGSHLTVPVRATGSFLYYTYDSTGTSVHVHSPGASLLSGLRVGGTRGSATLLGGGEVRWEHRETAGSTPSQRDATTLGFVVQADGDLALTKSWHALVLGNYAGAARYTYGRGALRHQATNLDWQGPTSVFLGVEGVGQGNNESRGFQGGGFVESSLVPQHLSLALHGGYKESWSPRENHRRGGYLGLSAYRAF